MMRDGNDVQSIRQDLQRWRCILENAEDQDALRAVRAMIDGSERRLAEIEGMWKYTTDQARR